AGALEHYRRAVAIKEERAPEKGDLAKTVNKVAVVLQTMGRYGDARAAFNREHDLLVDALGARADNTKWLNALATNRNLLAVLEHESGDDPQALALITEQQDITARLVARDPKNAMWQRNLAISDILWGDLLRLDDDVARSESHYRAALARLEPLIARDPSRALWKRDAVTAHNELAWLALARGSLDSSRSEIAEARALLATLKTTDDATQRAGWELAVAAGAIEARDHNSEAARREW